MGNAVAAGFAPTRAAAFEAVADRCFASRLDRSAADLPAFDPIGRVVRAVAMIAEVRELLAMHVADRRRRVGEVERFERGERCPTAFVLEPMAPRVEPCLAGRFLVRMQCFRAFDQMLLGVVRSRECTSRVERTSSTPHSGRSRRRIARFAARPA